MPRWTIRAGLLAISLLAFTTLLQGCCACKKRWMCETAAHYEGERYDGSGVSYESEAAARDDAARGVCAKHCHAKGQYETRDCPCVRTCLATEELRSAGARATCRSSGVY